jgi:hypothetical protein
MFAFTVLVNPETYKQLAWGQWIYLAYLDDTQEYMWWLIDPPSEGGRKEE